MRHFTKSNTCWVLLCCSMLMTAHSIYADRPVLPLNPDMPWPEDPDISAITDERIVRLWEDIMIAYRREYPTGATAGALFLSEEYMTEPNTPENQEILIDALSRALSTEPPDWNYVRAVLLLMQKGMVQDARIPQLADQLFTKPRAIKMSYNYGYSLRSMFHILEQQKTKETTELLYRACQREYWGDDPMHTPGFSKEHSEVSIAAVRRFALSMLAEMPPELSIPLLETLAAAYPEEYVPPAIVTKPATKWTKEWADNIDFSHQDIRARLDEARAKE